MAEPLEQAEGQPNRSATPRGFAIYDQFKDRNGHGVRVQESSLATEDCVWIFCEDVTGKAWGISPHLTTGMARRVRDALDAFISEHQDEAAEARPAACGLCRDGLVEAKGCNCGSPADEAAGFRHENLCGFEPCPNGCWDRLHPDTAPEWLCAVPADCANGPGPHQFTPVAGDPLPRPCCRQPQEMTVVPAVLAADDCGCGLGQERCMAAEDGDLGG